MEDIEDMFKGDETLETKRPTKPLIRKNKKVLKKKEDEELIEEPKPELVEDELIENIETNVPGT